ncbi:germin-like protein 9-3 [Nicotiana tomentosiformis]|uniref:germin-like protein 9-3 n=1 Tax=Nicotiana tomentosiformis TaxID=4098 RepID=UPI00051AC805
MASCLTKIVVVFVVAILTSSWMAQAGDPYILTDFIVPKDQTGETMDGNFFTFTGMHGSFGSIITNFKVTKAYKAKFPALLAVLQFSGTGVNPPHTHPRAAELLFMVQRNLQVGLRDSTNKVYTRTLQFGDLFLFPKGLVHYQYNCDWNKSAIAVSATGSANAGTV